MPIGSKVDTSTTAEVPLDFGVTAGDRGAAADLTGASHRRFTRKTNAAGSGCSYRWRAPTIPRDEAEGGGQNEEFSQRARYCVSRLCGGHGYYLGMQAFALL